MEKLFKLKIEPKVKVGMFFRCEDGSEAWMWHKIVGVHEGNNFNTARITFVWYVEKSACIAEPLSTNLAGFKRDVASGEYTLVQYDERIPYDLYRYNVETQS